VPGRPCPGAVAGSAQAPQRIQPGRFRGREPVFMQLMALQQQQPGSALAEPLDAQLRLACCAGLERAVAELLRKAPEPERLVSAVDQWLDATPHSRLGRPPWGDAPAAGRARHPAQPQRT
jgi:hypothetical protein